MRYHSSLQQAYQAGEPVDDACAEAIRVYKRALKGTKPFTPAPCGTAAGDARHRREKTPVCDPCKEARNKRRREERAKAKELENKE
ncbi:hypothetical protein GCM10007173_13700 [Glutamicibacter ardleyensis]|uniref:Uncharacterized protein n=1 Tax=Glutamicibacter ardleyensis TaxID=225894 RepID=A0ABQ2DH89_9MICC|nr:hypothetical protein GCM10007173_13700 [Glutamicibacter ardleyensis]